MNLVRKIAKTFKSEKISFRNRAEHEWIFSSPELRESFRILEAYISQSQKALEVFNTIFFLNIKGSYASAIDSGEKFVLVYPELVSLLKGPKRIQGIAILAHEIGHLVLAHHQRRTSNHIAQIEADLFAHEIGLGRYLLLFLKDQSQGLQIQKRVQALEKVIRTES
ncbi:M48 family metalloprotease [Halobacteriovorax sp. HLS]|uniref:M48 family metalloprotease n=1 Tax=Halobacteriovorax sp. HLS TaxID=2234000 RepID=UPI000FD94DC9|nr:M48 family metalloprotease [Halobacteriovorax sp. HLS]